MCVCVCVFLTVSIYDILRKKAVLASPQRMLVLRHSCISISVSAGK